MKLSHGVPVRCDDCSKHFANKYILKRHINSIHHEISSLQTPEVSATVQEAFQPLQPDVPVLPPSFQPVLPSHQLTDFIPDIIENVLTYHQL